MICDIRRARAYIFLEHFSLKYTQQGAAPDKFIVYVYEGDNTAKN